MRQFVAHATRKLIGGFDYLSAHIEDLKKRYLLPVQRSGGCDFGDPLKPTIFTIRKTAFAIQSRFSGYCFVTQCCDVYFISFTLVNP